MFIINKNKLNAKDSFGITNKEYGWYLFGRFLATYGRAVEEKHRKIFVIDGNYFHLIKNECGRELTFMPLKKIEEFV
jgi:hypothetical protein